MPIITMSGQRQFGVGPKQWAALGAAGVLHDPDLARGRAKLLDANLEAAHTALINAGLRSPDNLAAAVQKYVASKAEVLPFFRSLEDYNRQVVAQARAAPPAQARPAPVVVTPQRDRNIPARTLRPYAFARDTE